MNDKPLDITVNGSNPFYHNWQDIMKSGFNNGVIMARSTAHQLNLDSWEKIFSSLNHISPVSPLTENESYWIGYIFGVLRYARDYTKSNYCKSKKIAIKFDNIISQLITMKNARNFIESCTSKRENCMDNTHFWIQLYNFSRYGLIDDIDESSIMYKTLNSIYNDVIRNDKLNTEDTYHINAPGYNRNNMEVNVQKIDNRYELILFSCATNKTIKRRDVTQYMPFINFHKATFKDGVITFSKKETPGIWTVEFVD